MDLAGDEEGEAAHARPPERVFRKEARPGMRLVEILDDGERLRQRPSALVDERRHQGLRIHGRVFGLAVLAPGQMDEHRIEGESFQVQRDAYPERGRTPKVGVELHNAGAIFTLSSPTLSIPASRSSPGFTGPTPAGVPVKMTSPGSSV